MTYEEKIAYYNHQIDSVSQLVLHQMKAGAEKWEMPWYKGIPQAQNLYTGKFYGGRNMILLWQQCLQNKYPKNGWATFAQWRKMGATIKRGEQGTLICIAIPRRRGIKRKQHPELFNSEEYTKIDSDNVYFAFRFKYVFNQSQVNGYFGDQPGLFEPVTDPAGMVNALLTKSGAKIVNGGTKAYYNYALDEIRMPELARFTNHGDYTALEKYNSVVLHELIHWTGHYRRCNRKMGMPGLKGYALEELVAEIGNAVLSTHLNYRVYPRDIHASYLQNWLLVLENDFSYFTEALELARYAIYWLFKQTGLFEDVLKKQHDRQMSDERVSRWQELEEQTN